MVDDPDHKGSKRYIADPAEVSAVDSPCLPSALVESMKGRTVTLQKAGGATEQVPLEIISLDTARLGKMEQDLEALKREFSDDRRKRDAGTGAALPDGSFPIENEGDLKIAIHAYGRASDKAKAKEHIIARAKSLGLTHLLPDGWVAGKACQCEACAKLALENSPNADDPSATGGEGDQPMKITDQAGLTKAAKTLADHLDKHMEMHKAHHEKVEGVLSKDHPIVKSSQAMMDHCEKCMKAAKDAGAGEEPEEADKVAPIAAEAVVKAAVDAAVAPLKTQLDELVAKLAKTAAPGGPHSGAPVPVEKTAPSAFDELVAAPAVTH